MPRPKTLSDDVVLAAALALMHERGPEALTFAALAGRCGLSAATLVQRFGSKAGLAKAALLHAWDGLDAKTAELASKAARTPDGAIDLLAALSVDYGDIDAYAEGLLMLREDLHDPDLRARGKAWGDRLALAIDGCFADAPGAPAGIGRLMASQWQGALLWWSFDPALPVAVHVRRSLAAFVGALLRR